MYTMHVQACTAVTCSLLLACMERSISPCTHAQYFTTHTITHTVQCYYTLSSMAPKNNFHKRENHTTKHSNTTTLFVSMYTVTVGSAKPEVYSTTSELSANTVHSCRTHNTPSTTCTPYRRGSCTCTLYRRGSCTCTCTHH